MGKSTPPQIFGALALFSLALSSLALTGCGSDRVEKLRVEPANPFYGNVQPLGGGVQPQPVGKPVQTGPYTVVLAAPTTPAVGANRFVVRITERGDTVQNVSDSTDRFRGLSGRADAGPAEDLAPVGGLSASEESAVAGRETGDAPGSGQANAAGKPASGVMVSVSLSRASMEAMGPTVAMRRTGPGTYAGTANITDPGGWVAKVTVVGPRETSTAFYAVSTDGTTAGQKPQESATSVQTGSKPIQPLPDAPGTWGNAQFGRE